jgi:hypothetical protein
MLDGTAAGPTAGGGTTPIKKVRHLFRTESPAIPMSSAAHPDAAALAEHVSRRLAAGASHPAIEYELYAAFGYVARGALAAAFRRAADLRWREAHPELMAEPDADRSRA